MFADKSLYLKRGKLIVWFLMGGLGFIFKGFKVLYLAELCY